MGMMLKVQVLGVLAVGCAIGAGVAACIGTARASDTVMVDCPAGNTASNTYPGMTPEQLAGLSIVIGHPDGRLTSTQGADVDKDGVVRASCVAGTQVYFVMR